MDNSFHSLSQYAAGYRLFLRDGAAPTGHSLIPSKDQKAGQAVQNDMWGKGALKMWSSDKAFKFQARGAVA